MMTTSRSRWWISLALLVLGGAMGFGFLSPREPWPSLKREERDQNVLRIVYTQPLRPDPHARLFPLPSYNMLIQSLWEPLIECDPHTGEPQPAAAESWSWSEDHRVLTLSLRRDARWSNGDAVTAHDFVRGWLRLLRGRIDIAFALFPIKGAETYHRGARNNPEAVGLRALDDQTLQIELDQPRTSLVAEIADPMLAPLHASAEKVLADRSFCENPWSLITNGPFRLVAANADGYRLEANPRYHGHGTVRLAGVQFSRANNPSVGALMLAAGTADLLPSMSYLPYRPLPTERSTAVESELTLGVVALFFNVTRGPLRDLRVRQALALALDREELIADADRPRLVPAWSWVPDMPGRQSLALFSEDASEARRLLAEAGYPEGEGFPILRMAMPQWMEGNPYPGACRDRWFQELGVRVYVSYEGSAARHKRINVGDYDVIYGSLLATSPDPADLLAVFTMPGELSETKWRDEEAVKILAAANRRVGAERLELVEQAERRMMAGASAVPVMFERRHTLRSTEVQGWYGDPLGRQSVKRLWLDHTLAVARDTATGP